MIFSPKLDKDSGCIKLNRWTGRLVRAGGMFLLFIALWGVLIIYVDSNVSFIYSVFMIFPMVFSFKLLRARSYLKIGAERLEVYQRLYSKEISIETDVEHFKCLKVVSDREDTATPNDRQYFYIFLVAKRDESHRPDLQLFSAFCGNMIRDESETGCDIDLSNYYTTYSSGRVMKFAKLVSQVTGLPITVSDDDRACFENVKV